MAHSNIMAFDEALQARPGNAGALTVVMGSMSAGKCAVGFAYARTVLANRGYVTVCQPVERGGAVTRRPADLATRLGKSMAQVLEGDAWHRQIFMLQPTSDGAMSTAAKGWTFAASFTRGNFFPADAQKLNWHLRMVVVQDFNVLWRNEPELAPARLRGLAMEHQVNIVLLVDTTGGDREIGHTRELPAKAPGGKSEATPVPPPKQRAVMVHAGQVLLAEAAHRLVYVEKTGAGGLLLHTLKSPQGALYAQSLQLDPGFLAWPPDRLENAHPVDGDPERVRDGDASQDPALHEAPRG